MSFPPAGLHILVYTIHLKCGAGAKKHEKYKFVVHENTQPYLIIFEEKTWKQNCLASLRCYNDQEKPIMEKETVIRERQHSEKKIGFWVNPDPARFGAVLLGYH